MESILKTANIVKKYGNRTVLKNINMNINKGDIYGFIGKNGAGKTTFMRVVLSLTPKDSGEVIYYDNKSINDIGLKVGSLIESPGLYKNASAYENMKRFSILYGADESKINEILNMVGLDNTGKRKAKDFSLGMRQRLGIAIALLGEPELLILDEPINGLDPEGIKEIRDVIVKLNKEKNITFLISSHLLDELSKIVTKYGIINNGELIEEISAKELNEKCKNRLIIEVNDTEQALSKLVNIIPKEDIKVNNNSIEINSHIKESSNINKLLVESGIMVNAIYPNLDSLEEYFMKRIGE
mgnify:FL=1